MTNNRVTQKLGLKYPLIQGPFGGGLSSVKLLSTVSNEGGLGSFGAHYLSAQEIEALTKEIRGQTQKPFAINLWVGDRDGDGMHLPKAQFELAYEKLKPYFEELGLKKPEYPESFGKKFNEQIEGLLRAKPPVFSFVYGVPDSAVLNECRKLGITTIGTAITPDEAVALDEAGVDLIVATGFEAGGHRVSFLRLAENSLFGTLALIPQVVDQVKAPVIAAGGIADRRGVAAALALGAEGVQIGTAFLATEESNAGELHRSKLFSSEAKYTALTRGFTGRLARGIPNRMMREMNQYHSQDLAPYPAQAWFTSKLKQAALDQNRGDLMSLWCGQAAPLMKHRRAIDVIKSLFS